MKRPAPAVTAFGASRTKINSAGDVLRTVLTGENAWLLRDDQVEALELVAAFRSEFQDPLRRVVMGLRSMVRSEQAPVVVGQRLKRMPQIANKLVRFPTMELSRIQDIGGCRAILPSARYVDGVRRRIHQRWDVMSEKDYVKEPKPTGYRAVHVIVRRRGHPIEIQLRTMGQHRWAETVEQLELRTRYPMKDGQGPDVLQTYYERAAYLVDRMDAGEPVEDEFNALFADARQAAFDFLTKGR